MATSARTDVLFPAAPQLSRFCTAIGATFPVLARTLSNYLLELQLEPDFPTAAETLVDLAYRLGAGIGLSPDDVHDAYADFCLTFLREQDLFRKTGEYRNAAHGFEQVKHEVYEDDEYMSHYMLGHLLSCAVFPHHYQQYRFFVNRFVPAVGPDARVFEFGPGHGLWLSSFLAHSPGRHGQGCDISPMCIRLAEQMRQLWQIAPARFRLIHGDAVQYDLAGQEFDAMIASGLLEHVEDPWAFLRRIRGHLRPETGRLFTMVPTNTAHPDHLVLFRSVDEIRAMYTASGFAVAEELVLSQGNLGASEADDASFLHLGILYPLAG
jgi:2-polyprenyl-3-methyl-5-hydroxy-6-metoxy-1,4-benzoquinol methylase